MAWPQWARWASAIAALIGFDAFFFSWGEDDFGSSFTASSAAILIYHARSIGSVAAGIYLGVKVASYFKKSWLGWIVGILCTLTLFEAIDSLKYALPGVPERVRALQDSDCHTDWDGRSNPTVCD